MEDGPICYQTYFLIHFRAKWSLALQKLINFDHSIGGFGFSIVNCKDL
jgi:hypothetical protein